MKLIFAFSVASEVAVNLGNAARETVKPVPVISANSISSINVEPVVTETPVLSVTPVHVPIHK